MAETTTALNYQIGAISYPGGEFRKLTNDVTSHPSLSLSADGKVLSTLLLQSHREISLLPASGTGEAMALPGLPPRSAISAFAWSNDGALLVADGAALRRYPLNGGEVSTLISDNRAYLSDLMICGPRYVAFNWFSRQRDNSWKIWRSDQDGSNPKMIQPLSGVGVVWGCSSDEKYIYYTDFFREPGIRRISVDGASSEMVPGTEFKGESHLGIAVSPDGGTLTALLQGAAVSERRVAILDLRTPSPSVRSLSLDPNLNLSFNLPGPPSAISFEFTPDGKSIAFAVQDKGIDNIWVQPLDGSKRRQITHFKSDVIYDFRWSKDGSHLGVNRGNDLGDIVSLRDKALAGE